MFEVFVTICLVGTTDVCRDTLVPVQAFSEIADCEKSLNEMPDRAFCAGAGEALAFEEVAQGVFVHRGAIAEPDGENRGDVANIGFIIGEKAVAVVDAGSARWIAEATWRAVRKVTDLPITHLVITHMHPDHALGAPFSSKQGQKLSGMRGLTAPWQTGWTTTPKACRG